MKLFLLRLLLSVVNVLTAIFTFFAHLLVICLLPGSIHCIRVNIAYFRLHPSDVSFYLYSPLGAITACILIAVGCSVWIYRSFFMRRRPFTR